MNAYRMNIFSFFLPENFLAAFGCAFSSSKSSQTSNQSSTAYDQRVGVGDSGVLAQEGASVDQSINDNRDLSDHSTFNSATTSTAIDARDLSDNSSFAPTTTTHTSSSSSTTSVDSRDLSDHSQFTTSTTTTDARTDARDLSDRSTTYAADAEVLKATAAGAFSSANLLTTQSTNLFEAALKFGDAGAARAAETSAHAIDKLSVAAASSIGLARQATDLVAANAQSADSGNTEKLIKGGVAVAALVVAALVFRRKAA